MISTAPRKFVASFQNIPIEVTPTGSIAHRVNLNIHGVLTILTVAEAKLLSRALVECANEVAPAGAGRGRKVR